MFDLMAPADRRRLLWLLPVVTLNAVIQVIGIASIMPFLALVGNPDTVSTNAYLRWAFETFRFSELNAFLVFVGLGVLGVMIVSNTMAAFTHLRLLRFSWDMNHLLAVRMLREYLYKPYVFFLDQNTSGLAKNILGEVKQVVTGYLMSGLNLVAHGFSAALILGLLIVVNPVLALVSFGLLGGSYLLVFRLVRSRLTDAGRRRSAADKARYKTANEALAGAKDIKLLGKEAAFLKRFTSPSRNYGRAMARQQVIGLIPRYVLETLAFGGLLLIVLVMLVQDQGLATVLPTLGVYAFASYRLLPALQSIFGSFSSMRFSATAVEVLHADLQQGEMPQEVDRDAIETLPLRHRLELRDVGFTYPGASHPLFDGFDLVIEPKTTVALVGATGSGKTTAVDLLLGLLEPDSGSVMVDDVPVTGATMSAWQKNIGYVPQVIFLADDTVAANIAFGVPRDAIDHEAVVRAAKQANIHTFIEEQMPQGYDTQVGERGIRLSGGQRQRLGIARALYHDPNVLILDEATSALDNVTEESVFGAVKDIGVHKTVVMIAHRMSTVRECDKIYLLDKGRILASGTFDELLDVSPAFRALAKVDVDITDAAAVIS
jgi:ATP-binding cassette, subfamily B, bacterial PglK